jgi:hypothetical protein
LLEVVGDKDEKKNNVQKIPQPKNLSWRKEKTKNFKFVSHPFLQRKFSEIFHSKISMRVEALLSRL